MMAYAALRYTVSLCALLRWAFGVEDVALRVKVTRSATVKGKGKVEAVDRPSKGEVAARRSGVSLSCSFLASGPTLLDSVPRMKLHTWGPARQRRFGACDWPAATCRPYRSSEGRHVVLYPSLHGLGAAAGLDSLSLPFMDYTTTLTCNRYACHTL